MLFRILQPEHLLVILAVGLIFFGPGKLPQLGKTIGKAFRELREGLNGEEAAAPAPAAEPSQARVAAPQSQDETVTVKTATPAHD